MTLLVTDEKHSITEQITWIACNCDIVGVQISEPVDVSDFSHTCDEMREVTGLSEEDMTLFRLRWT